MPNLIHKIVTDILKSTTRNRSQPRRDPGDRPQLLLAEIFQDALRYVTINREQDRSGALGSGQQSCLIKNSKIAHLIPCH